MIPQSFLLILAICCSLSSASKLERNQTISSTTALPEAEGTTDLKWLHAIGKHQQVNRTRTSPERPTETSPEQEPEASANWLSFLSSAQGPKSKVVSSSDNSPALIAQPDDSHLLSAMSMIPSGRRRFDDNTALASTGQIRGNHFIMPDSSELAEFNRQLQKQLNHLQANDVAIDEEALIKSLTAGIGMKPDAPQRRMDGFGLGPMTRQSPTHGRFNQPPRSLIQPFSQPMTSVADKRSASFRPSTMGTNTYYSTKNLNLYGSNPEQAAPLQKDESEQPVELDDIFKDDDKTSSEKSAAAAAVGKRADSAPEAQNGDQEGEANNVSGNRNGNDYDDGSEADESDVNSSSAQQGDQTRLNAGASELLSREELDKEQRRPLVRGIEDPAHLRGAAGSSSLDSELDQQEEGEQSSVSFKKTKQPKQVDIVYQGTKTPTGNSDTSSANLNGDDDESSAASHVTKSATDLQAAAGHHHGHSHGHYYQYVEVPKKKAWKFGFKRGNHKHTIMREEKGYKNKFHSSFKWHAKEKCKKHHKCASHGKMTWHYEHHDKKKGHH